MADRWNGLQPYHEHVAAQALPHLTNEEVGHGAAHADAYDGDGDAPVSTSDSQEPPLSGEPEGLRGRIQIGGNALSPGGRSHGDLGMIGACIQIVSRLAVLVTYDAVRDFASPYAYVINALIYCAGKVLHNQYQPIQPYTPGKRGLRLTGVRNHVLHLCDGSSQPAASGEFRMTTARAAAGGSNLILLAYPAGQIRLGT